MEEQIMGGELFSGEGLDRGGTGGAAKVDIAVPGIRGGGGS